MELHGQRAPSHEDEDLPGLSGDEDLPMIAYSSGRTDPNLTRPSGLPRWRSLHKAGRLEHGCAQCLGPLTNESPAIPCPMAMVHGGAVICNVPLHEECLYAHRRQCHTTTVNLAKEDNEAERGEGQLAPGLEMMSEEEEETPPSCATLGPRGTVTCCCLACFPPLPRRPRPPNVLLWEFEIPRRN